MANTDGSAGEADHKQGEAIEERLAPLLAAASKRGPGRIETLADARSALGIPRSSDSDVLKTWGVPSDFQLVAFPVLDENQPQLVAEFAVLRMIKRQGRRLIARPASSRLHLREKSNALWIVYGSIAKACTGTLVIESLSIGPAFADQLSRKGDEIAFGISAPLLRLISPARLLSESVEQLQRSGHMLELAAAHFGAPPMSEKQRDLLKQIEQGRPRQAPITDDQLAMIARRYIELCQRGLRHPLPRLALELGITRTQARDRIHKARQRKYLGPGKRGQATATIGPRLKKLGWSPPSRPPDNKAPRDQPPT